MSIPPNQFRREHPWTRFVLLDSSVGPVPSQAKVTHSLTLSLKKIQLCSCTSTETSTDDVLRGLTGRVDRLVDIGCQPALLSHAIRKIKSYNMLSLFLSSSPGKTFAVLNRIVSRHASGQWSL